jgi:CRISPR system Cascade subunit CasC
MKVELHLVQNFAPACLNRDDTNTPKDCEFGGVRRARISSQCLKRAIRTHPVFAQTLGDGTDMGLRTKLLKDRLREHVTAAGKDAETADQFLKEFVPAFAAQMDKKHPGQTSVLLYLGHHEVEAVAQCLLANWDQLAKAKKGDKLIASLADECRTGTKAADVVLFGRMMADQPKMNVEAACQVAHAISTHRVNMEMDFYTAVDDLQPQEDTGAGMMGVTGFNSSCFYRYSLVDTKELADNLKGDAELARRAFEAFLRASVVAIPSGKQNSMAAQNLPSLVLTVVRESGPPCSLANAFAKPVRPGRDEDLVEASITALDAYWGRITGAYGSAGIIARPALCVEEAELPNLGDQKASTFETLVSRTMEAVAGGGEET